MYKATRYNRAAAEVIGTYAKEVIPASDKHP